MYIHIFTAVFQSIYNFLEFNEWKLQKHDRERCHFVSGNLCPWRHGQGRHMWQKCVLYVMSQPFSALHWLRASLTGTLWEAQVRRGGGGTSVALILIEQPCDACEDYTYKFWKYLHISTFWVQHVSSFGPTVAFRPATEQFRSQRVFSRLYGVSVLEVAWFRLVCETTEEDGRFVSEAAALVRAACSVSRHRDLSELLDFNVPSVAQGYTGKGALENWAAVVWYSEYYFEYRVRQLLLTAPPQRCPLIIQSSFRSLSFISHLSVFTSSGHTLCRFLFVCFFEWSSLLVLSFIQEKDSEQCEFRFIWL